MIDQHRRIVEWPRLFGEKQPEKIFTDFFFPFPGRVAQFHLRISFIHLTAIKRMIVRIFYIYIYISCDFTETVQPIILIHKIRFDLSIDPHTLNRIPSHLTLASQY